MKTIFTSLLVLLCSSLFAQAGSLDPSFANNGIYQDQTRYYGDALGRKLVKVLPDGRIIVACFGNFHTGTLLEDFSVFRLNANGTLDSSFGTNGRTSIPFEGESPNQTHSSDYVMAMAIQADGKIVLAGVVHPYEVINNNAYDIGVARLNPNGTIDSTFNKNGRKQIDLKSYLTPESTCYNSDSCTGVVVRDNGLITLSGYTTNCSGSQTNHDAFLVQLNANGSFQKKFASGGVQIFSKPNTEEFISGSALQSNGKLLLVGSTSPVNSGSSPSNILLERVNANGTLDTTFNGTGYTVNDIANGSYDNGTVVAVLPSGKILVGAMANNSVYLLRYNAKGKLDNTFGLKGRVLVDSLKTLTSLSVAPDGKIVLTTRDFSVYRCLPDGTRDNSFGTNGYTSLNDPRSTCDGSAVQPDGKILAVGSLLIIVPRGGSSNADIVARFLGTSQTSANNNYIAAIKPALSTSGFDVSVYQNPSPDHFGIRISGNSTNEQITIKVMDFSGKVMEVFSGVKPGEVKQFGSRYPSGTYLLNVSQGRNHKSVTVLKL